MKFDTIDVEVTYINELLGTASANPEIHADFIASKAPDAKSREEEIEAIGAEAEFEKGMTVFPRNKKGEPFTWDYQWKGFFKDSCGLLKRADDSKSKGIKAYKKEIDGLVFVSPRIIPLVLPEGGEVCTCQRPLRASTAQGERIALATSESVPAGTVQRFEVTVLKSSLMPAVVEWLQYGLLHGTGQWRNSGKGSFAFRAERDGEVVAESYSRVGLPL